MVLCYDVVALVVAAVVVVCRGYELYFSCIFESVAVVYVVAVVGDR